MLKIAIVGLGQVFNYQVEAINKLENIEIVALCDVIKNIKTIPDYLLGIPLYQDYKELEKHEKFDMVLIATSPSLHYEMAMFYISKNIQVLVEKPLSFDIDECRRMLVQSENKVITAFHARYAEDLNWFESNCPIENIIKIKCAFYDPYFINDLSPHAISLGGSWMDSGVNALSVISRLVKGIVSHSALSIHENDFNGIVINSKRTYELKTKRRTVFIEIDTDWTKGVNLKTTEIFYGDGTSILLDHSNQCVLINNKIQFIYEGIPRLVKHYVNLFDDVYNMWLKGESNNIESLLIHEILHECL